jgi:hypothetical protein
VDWFSVYLMAVRLCGVKWGHYELRVAIYGTGNVACVFQVNYCDKSVLKQKFRLFIQKDSD